MMRAEQPRLQIREDEMDHRQMRFRLLGIARPTQRLMVEAEIGQFPVARRAVVMIVAPIAIWRARRKQAWRRPVGTACRRNPPRIDLAFGRRAAANASRVGARLFRLPRATSPRDAGDLVMHATPSPRVLRRQGIRRSRRDALRRFVALGPHHASAELVKHVNSVS